MDHDHAVMVHYALGMSDPAGLTFASLPEARGKLGSGWAQIRPATRPTRAENELTARSAWNP